MNKDDQIQADDGPEILTRSATLIPMPNVETAPQGDGQKVSSDLTLSGQRSLKEQVQERVERIQADVSKVKDT